MITVRTSPAYVNRVRQDWTANGGVYGDGGVYATVISNDPFAQLGPTLDLTFAGVPTDQFTAATTDGYSINLNLSSEIYQIAVEYAVWSGYQVNYALLPAALTEAALNTEPAKTLFKDTLIGGRPLGDINNDGSVTSADATAYQRFNGPFWLNTADRNDYIRTVLNPYMLANPGLYAAYLTPSTGLAQQTFAEIITFTRTGTGGTFFNSAGVLTAAAADQPRFDYNPSTLAAQGLLIEEQRTNSIRNNTMQGAVAGTPGTLPTNWTILGGGIGTLTQQIVGTGTSNGINYIDYRVSGTTSTAGFTLSFEQIAQIVAANGQTWASSAWASLIGGSTTNISALNLTIDGRTAVGLFVGVVNNLNILGVTPTLTRYTNSGTIANASIERVVLGIAFVFASGVAIDITLRIGLPQLEQGAFATSVIPTTTTALTRSADVASVNTLSPWYNATEGTLFADGTGPIASIYRILAEGATASDFRDFSLAFDGLRGNFAARYVAGNFDVLGPTNSLTAGATVKLAGSYSATSADMAYNGVLAVSKNATTQRIPADRMFLGSRLGSSLQLNGYLRRITYYPRRLSNADLQTITA